MIDYSPQGKPPSLPDVLAAGMATRFPDAEVSAEHPDFDQLSETVPYYWIDEVQPNWVSHLEYRSVFKVNTYLLAGNGPDLSLSCRDHALEFESWFGRYARTITLGGSAVTLERPSVTASAVKIPWHERTIRYVATCAVSTRTVT